MIARFSLYGFLKNQQYFEPFFILVLLDRGLSFTQIGLALAVREGTVILFEVPSGAMADSFGRRRCMIMAFLGYIVSFLVLALSSSFPLILAGMFLFGFGDAFRTGTHKAMIFSWLKDQGRTDEKTQVYGYTRSWSKLGSAFSLLIACAIVWFTNAYSWVFLLSILPYLASVILFMTYPKSVDGPAHTQVRPGDSTRLLLTAMRKTIRQPALRGLVLESMGFEGVFHAIKDYLQPVLKTLAAVWIVARFPTWSGHTAQTSTLLIGPVYIILHLLSAWASRKAHRLQTYAGSENSASGMLWCTAAALYLLMMLTGSGHWLPATVVVFILLYILQNLWRPLLVSRFANADDDGGSATVLSLESMSRRFATMVAAPVIGLAMDRVAEGVYWPCGAAGLALAIPFVLKQKCRGGPEKIKHSTAND